MRLAMPFILMTMLALISPAESAPSTWDFTPTFDVRLRQESLVGVYHFAPDPDRNWIRQRTRAGFRYANPDHKLLFQLANEHRHILHPEDGDLNWDEIVIDQASWQWKANSSTTLTVGRQNVIWDKGFLMLEGHPLDGSRSIYQNALRMVRKNSWGSGEVLLIHNPKYDPFVLVDDQDKALSAADETAAAVRLKYGSKTFSLIWKQETDPDLLLPDFSAVTLASRWDGTVGTKSKLMAEIALQHQDGATRNSKTSGWALAMQASAKTAMGHKIEAEAEFFYYSGGSDDLLPFRAPWGNWPKWSELYIYTLIGESEPGRVHVAAWENIAAPRLTLRRPLWDGASARATASYLLAPEPDWTARGLLLAAELKFNLPADIKGHLLWEMLEPGDFHDGSNGLAPLDEAVHFLRWQLSYTFN